jgi:hypothetical protein
MVRIFVAALTALKLVKCSTTADTKYKLRIDDDLCAACCSFPNFVGLSFLKRAFNSVLNT